MIARPWREMASSTITSSTVQIATDVSRHSFAVPRRIGLAGQRAVNIEVQVLTSNRACRRRFRQANAMLRSRTIVAAEIALARGSLGRAAGSHVKNAIELVQPIISHFGGFLATQSGDPTFHLSRQ